MVDFYNEIDPYAAQWLRNLIAAGHLHPGVVDTRDVRLIEPDELRRYRRCHFFAGIGVWAHALVAAGWPEDVGVWTGSCPCQPFSNAGKAAGFADERHLWPYWHHLIRECRPGVVFGEQVAAKAALDWFDLVHADLEGEGYAVGAADLCAAGVGAPHIRQRLFFVADSGAAGQRGSRRRGEHRGGQSAADADLPHEGGTTARLLDDDDEGLAGHGLRTAERQGDGVRAAARQARSPGIAGALADDDKAGCGEQRGAELLDGQRAPQWHDADGCGATRGFWSPADWIACRDGKARPVEPGSFPLAHGAAARVGRLRAYGNAIVAPLAVEFVRAYLDVKGQEIAH